MWSKQGSSKQKRWCLRPPLFLAAMWLSAMRWESVSVQNLHWVKKGFKSTAVLMAAVLKFCRWGERRAIPCCLYTKETLQPPCWGAACPGNSRLVGSRDSLWKQIPKAVGYVGKYWGIVLFCCCFGGGRVLISMDLFVLCLNKALCQRAAPGGSVLSGHTAPSGCIACCLVTALPLACTFSCRFLFVAAQGREIFPPIYWTIPARSHSHHSPYGSFSWHWCCCWDLPLQLPERAPAGESCC